MEIRIFGKSFKSLRFFLYIYSYIISKFSHIINWKKPPEKYRNILLIRADFLGDAVLNTALISAVRKTFINAKITLVAEKNVASLFENDLNIHKTIGVSNEVKFVEGVRLISRLFQRKYDLILDVTSRWWTIILGTLSIPFARRADRETLMIVDVIWRNYRVFTGHYEREYKREHDLIRALRVIKDFYDFRNVPETYLPLPKDVDGIFHHVATRFNLESKGYFIVTPGSQWEVRRWNVNKFAQAAIEISRRYHLHIVITGIQKEAEICNQLYQLTGKTSINLAGQLSMQEFLALVYHSRLLIGNDSGPAHVAAGLKIPLVVIMGTADVEVFKPWGKNVRICYREVLCGPCYSGRCYMPKNICLQPVTVNEVIAAVENLLGDSHHNGKSSEAQN